MVSQNEKTTDMNNTIKLDNLKLFSYVPSEKLCDAFAEAAAVCLDFHNHTQKMELTITGDIIGNLKIEWEKSTLQIKNSWNDLPEATEAAATCLALWVVEKFTDLKVVGRSQKKTGIDYWLGKKTDDFPFQKTARLEISGLLQGSIGRVNQRLKEKVKQVEKSNAVNLPVYIIIIEFSQVLSKTVVK